MVSNQIKEHIRRVRGEVDAAWQPEQETRKTAVVHEALAQCSAEQLTALQEPLAAVQAALQDAEMRSIRAEAKLAHQTSFANVRHYAKKTLRALDRRVPGGMCD